MMDSEKTKAIRSAIIASLPLETSGHGQTPQQKDVYIPPSHIKALYPECNLVIGARGVGKTFWSAALRSREIRAMLDIAVPNLANVEVSSGFGESPNTDLYPSGNNFSDLLKKGHEAYNIWCAVLARWLRQGDGQLPCDSWENTVDWVKNEPEKFDRLLEMANSKFAADGRSGMIVFDALDRTSTDWQTMDTIVRDLLKVTLMLKPFKQIHGKIFLREDQFTGRPVTNFPDASKLLATQVNLTWAPHDLYGLLWQTLCNGPDGDGNLMREIYSQIVPNGELQKLEGVWAIDDTAKRASPIQRSLFVSLAGEWMGKSSKQGITYIWTVGHLADGQGRTSPRSFLAAIRAAAEDSKQNYPDHSYSLHYDSIKRGVRKASQIRVTELEEDYPWITTIKTPLQALVVPCKFDVIEERWKNSIGEHPTPESFSDLPPGHFKEGWAGVRKDLEGLGVFTQMKDGRVNMPDLFRVGFGLGRRGGVKPMMKSSGD